MIYAALLIAVTAAFYGLCVATPKHQTPLLGRKLVGVMSGRVRIAGWIILIAALALCWQQFGFARGLVLFAGLSSVGAAIVVAMLTRAQVR